MLAIRGAPLPHQGFITLYTDITEQKLYRELVQRQNAELEGHVRARTNELETAYTRLTQAMAANAEITSALKRSEARLRLITDTIPAHIAYFDHRWTYQYANRGYALVWLAAGRRGGQAHRHHYRRPGVRHRQRARQHRPGRPASHLTNIPWTCATAAPSTRAAPWCRKSTPTA